MREIFDRLEAALSSQIDLSPGQQVAQDVLDGPSRYKCLVGGTRSGKTFLIVRSILEAALAYPGSRHAILRFRANAARASVALDTLQKVRAKCFPHAELTEHRQDGYYSLPNSSQIWIGGLDDKDRVEKILGQEYVTIFLNEASQIPYASAVIAFTRLAQVIPGLQQRILVDLNPVEKTHWTNRLFGEKRDPITKLPVKNPDGYARAFLNPIDNFANLSPEFLTDLDALPPRQRRRFLLGEYVEDLEGALWTIDMIERCRVAEKDVPDLKRIVVAIDPAVSSGESAAETGIVVAGLGTDKRVYVLKDATGRFTPTEWAARAIGLYEAHSADRIVAETNQGGAMVENTIRAVNASVAYKGVHASRGKITRAEPVSALYATGKVLHVGDGFPKLEEQMTSYVAGGPSPDRLDALVWAVTELAVDKQAPTYTADQLVGRYTRGGGALGHPGLNRLAPLDAVRLGHCSPARAVAEFGVSEAEIASLTVRSTTR
ncbi:phage terminase large subunit [Methylobacterium sp. J-026]|uniref:phage terminase large subunit n=1 Tax=Methylobacterium sp. J-026 TaxID=2836624 RepID=UPI001FB9B121|nr:phage terminase large subunit [Methylobacterium sp. J-026]MCJ2136204.1 phage terminase large subunit [Methylobacterium sp. J-026]